MKKLVVTGILFVLLLLYFDHQFFIFERAKIFFSQSMNGKTWQNENEKYLNLYRNNQEIVFIGDSHIEQCEWHEIYPELNIANRGIPGETTLGLLERIDSFGKNGSTIFLQTGINDILGNTSTKTIIANYTRIIEHFMSKGCQIVVTLPFKTKYDLLANDKVDQVNMELGRILKARGIRCINLNARIASTGRLSAEFTLDGLHLNAAGYKIWISEIGSISAINSSRQPVPSQ